jgi:hypothetical protein
MRAATPNGDAYIMAGVAAGWRTGTGDADPDPELTKVWLDEFDAVSPWTVGRYNSEESADAFMRDRMRGDVETIKAYNARMQKCGENRKVDYVPVILPGSSVGFFFSLIFYCCALKRCLGIQYLQWTLEF